MSRKNEIEVLKNGLMQYIGAMLQAMEDEDNDKKMHIVLAKLSEAWLECCRKNNGSYDIFIAKPILRAASVILKDYAKKSCAEAPKDEETQKIVSMMMSRYDNATNLIDTLVEGATK